MTLREPLLACGCIRTTKNNVTVIGRAECFALPNASMKTRVFRVAAKPHRRIERFAAVFYELLLRHRIVAVSGEELIRPRATLERVVPATPINDVVPGVPEDAIVAGAVVGGGAASGGASGKVARVLKPSNTCAQRPHRTMPCCACNCGGVTRNVVAQLGHWVTMLMKVALYRLLPLISTQPSSCSSGAKSNAARYASSTSRAWCSSTPDNRI